MSAVVELEDVVRRYGGVRALDGVDLRIDAAEHVAVVGPSGCGKSTLLGVIGALERATSGAVRVLGEDLSALDDEARARFRRERIGFVFQSYDLLAHLTALENVQLQAAIAGRPLPEGAALFAELDIAGLEARFPDELSGGQKQRIGLARSLAHRPALVLADEPTGGLDSHAAQQAVATLRAAASALGSTLVVVTHDAAVAGQFARVIRLRDGRIDAPAAVVAHA